LAILALDFNRSVRDISMPTCIVDKSIQHDTLCLERRRRCKAAGVVRYVHLQHLNLASCCGCSIDNALDRGRTCTHVRLCLLDAQTYGAKTKRKTPKCVFERRGFSGLARVDVKKNPFLDLPIFALRKPKTPARTFFGAARAEVDVAAMLGGQQLAQGESNAAVPSCGCHALTGQISFTERHGADCKAPSTLLALQDWFNKHTCTTHTSCVLSLDLLACICIVTCHHNMLRHSE